MTEVAEVSIDEEGCIHLPLTLQNRLGLEPGATLILEEGEGGEMWLRPKERPPVLIDKGGVLVVRAKAVGDLVNATRRDRDSRVASLIARADL